MIHCRLSKIVVGFAFFYSSTTLAEEITLFNGKDLKGWTLNARSESEDIKKIKKEDVFFVDNGVLVCPRGLTLVTLRHEGIYEAPYVLSLEWRWGPNIASGTEIVIHSADKKDEYGRREEIQISLSVDDAGGISYKRPGLQIDTKHERQTDREVEKEMGEWNQLQIICREKMITVVVNGQPVNQVTDAPLSSGAIELGIAPVPIFYRNVKLIRPLGPKIAATEKAAEPLAAAWAKIVARKKAEQLKREQARRMEEAREEQRIERLVADRNSVIQSIREAVAADTGPEVAALLDAKALPYPSDARDLDFNSTFGMIDFKSGSSLQALTVFYLREMAKRGWIESESEASIEEDSIELNFKAAGGEFELELDERSDYVDVSIDTEGVDFEGTNDPASMAALGIPQPRKTLLLQKEVAIPADAQRLSFDDDSCMFYSTMKLKEAFAHFGKIIRQKGYRESRRPILSKKRNYTEFKRGGIELSVNIFKDPVGTRIILEYDDGKKDRVLPPLPELDLTKLNGESSATNRPESTTGVMKSGDAGASAESDAQINVAENRGSATVTMDGEKYVFPHVAAFRSKSDMEFGGSTSVVFSKQPIPFRQIQRKLVTQENFSFIDVYSFDLPVYFVVEVGKFSSLSLSVPGTGHSQGLKHAIEGAEIVNGRIRGTLKPSPQEEFNHGFSFQATVDAVVMTPSTTLAAGQVATASVGHGAFVDNAPPMPDDAEDFSRSGTNYSKTYLARVKRTLGEVVNFYRDALASPDWEAVETPIRDANEESLRFRNSTGTVAIRLKANNDHVDISITKSDDQKAKNDGVYPEPGKGRLILANAHNVPVVFTIGKTNYNVKAGSGAENLKGALNYTVAPGEYNILIKIPGQQPKREKIHITQDTAWGVVAMPTGGYFKVQLY